MVGVALEEVLEVQDLRPAAVDCEHDCAKSRLKLGVLVEVVEHDLANCITLELHHDANIRLRFIADVGDSLYDLLLDEVRHVDDHFALVYGVGDFGDDDTFASVLLRFDIGLAAYAELSSPELVHGRYSVVSADLGAGREVGTFDELHQVVNRAVGVVHIVRDAVTEFAEVVRRDVCGHTDCDARRAIEKEVGKLSGEYGRFLGCFVVVGNHVNGLFLEVVEHLLRNLLHTHFGVSHCGRTVAVDGAEVSVAIHERTSEGEVLRHTDNGVVHGGIAMRMVLTDHVTDNTCALKMLRVPCVVEHVHRIETAAMHRLQSVSNVGKCAAYNDGH